MKQAVVLFTLASAAVQVLAQAAVPGVELKGHGVTPCGRYLEVRASNDRVSDAAFAAWGLGFISGFNTWAKQPTTKPLPDPPAVLAHLDKHCRDRPADRMVDGVVVLIADLGGGRPFRSKW